MDAKEKRLLDKFLQTAPINHGHLADCPEDVAALAWEACLDAHPNVAASATLKEICEDDPYDSPIYPETRAWIRKIAAKHGLDLDALKGE